MVLPGPTGDPDPLRRGAMALPPGPMQGTSPAHRTQLHLGFSSPGLQCPKALVGSMSGRKQEIDAAPSDLGDARSEDVG